MSNRRYEVPTHLDVEDKLMLGLTVRQFLYVLVGSSAAYAAWDQLAAAGAAPRVLAAGTCVVLTLAFALARPAGRALEEWLIAALLFVAAPRRTIWQPREPQAADWRPAVASWQELTPDAVWADGAEA
jgi:PrgI family protein